MRVERVYDWHIESGIEERDPTHLDVNMKAGGAHRIGHLSDTHLGKGSPGVREGELRRWLETLTGLDVDAVVHTGDVVEFADDEETINRAFSLFEKLSVPLFGVPGNHDVTEPAEPGDITRRWGPFPNTVTIGSLRLWLLDSMAWPPADKRSQRERDAAADSGFYSRGALGPAQLRELKELMDNTPAPQGPEIAVVHHHLRQPVPPKPFYEQNADLMAPLEDADHFIECLRTRDVRLVLHGHRHQYVTPYAPFDDLLMINGGSSTPGEPPRRARILDIAHKDDAIRIWELVKFD